MKKTQHCWPTTSNIVAFLCTPCYVLSHKHCLHNHCFQFLLGLTMVPRESKNNAYSKFGRQTKSIMVFPEVAYNMLKTRWQPNFVSLQRLMCRILPIIHCTSLHCWELLRPFVHNCQHHPTSAGLAIPNKFVCTGPYVS